MTYDQVMKELKKLGTAQNVKVYKRHGAGDKLYGVSFTNLNKLKKKIKVDHDLAVRLWSSGNTDAQTLAIMIADPKRFSSAEADHWVNDIRYYLLADLLAGLTAKAPFASEKIGRWIKSKKEYVCQCGYALLASALKDGIAISNEACRDYLRTIETEINNSPNRARHAMNSALIAIGIYRESLRGAAIDAASRIGKVKVDHGETSCKTPDAIDYINRAVSRKRVARKS